MSKFSQYLGEAKTKFKANASLMTKPMLLDKAAEAELKGKEKEINKKYSDIEFSFTSKPNKNGSKKYKVFVLYAKGAGESLKKMMKEMDKYVELDWVKNLDEAKDSFTQCGNQLK